MDLVDVITVRDSELEIGQQIGRPGAFGTVYDSVLLYPPPRRRVAVKVTPVLRLRAPAQARHVL
jgi:hypothetical protein